MLRVIEYLLFLFIFLIPWQARWVIRAGELNEGFWEYGTVGVYATDILFFIILVLVSVLWVQKDSKISKQFQNPKFKFFVSGVALTAYVFLSILWSSEKLVAVYAALKLFEGIGLFLLIRSLQHQDARLPFGSLASTITWAFVASAVVQSVLAIAQFFTQSVFAWPFSGIAPQDPSNLGVAVVQFGEERWLRAYGSFPHPNLLGAFLAIALLLLFGRIKSEIRNPKSETNSKFKILNSKWVLIAGYALLGTGLFFTFSRAAWLAFAVGLLALVVQQKLWRERLFQQLAGIGIILGMVLLVLFFPLIQTRLSGVSRLELKSTSERFVGYQEAWQLVTRHPLLGVGMGNETAALHDEIRSNDSSWSYQPVHNVFLLILAELGIVGFFLFIWFFWQTKKFIIHNSYFIIPILILFLFDHSFWTLHSGILTLWFVVALTGALGHASFLVYERQKTSE